MLKNYLKIAYKVLLRRKFYTAVSLFGIAFTLLILNVCVAFVDHFFAATAPESRLGRILTIERAQMFGESFSSSSRPGYALLDRYARDLPGVEAMSIASDPDRVTAFVDGEKLTPRLRLTDATYWEILDFDFVEGSPYSAADVESGNAVAVINESMRERFFGDRPAIGAPLRTVDRTLTVVGVVRDVPFLRALAHSEIWAPVTTSRSTVYRTELLGPFVGILLAEDRSRFGEIRDEFQSRLAGAQLPDPERFHTLQSGAYTRVEHLAREFFAAEHPEDRPGAALLGVFVAIGLLFMALPALNLVNLSLSRILERSSEIGVRKAFGASSRTLVGQFLTESVVLTLIGAAISLALTEVVLRLLSRIDVIPYAELSLNPRAFVAGIGVALVFAVVSGTYPAWKMSRLHPVEALHGRSA